MKAFLLLILTIALPLQSFAAETGAGESNGMIPQSADTTAGYGNDIAVPPVAPAPAQSNPADLNSGTPEFIQQIDGIWNRNDRNMVQIKTEGDRGNIGFCGTFHYNPNLENGKVVDNYAEEMSACAMSSVFQTWKDETCPESTAGCRIQWGNLAHETKPRYDGNKSNLRGRCWNIRPMRKEGFENSAVNIQSESYDRQTTAKFISLLKERGANRILFNDIQAGGQFQTGHDNVIYACFDDTEKAAAACRQYRYDKGICGDL